MNTVLRIVWKVSAALALAGMMSSGAHASVGSGPVQPCTVPGTVYTFTVSLTKSADGTPVASPGTNKDATCVMGSDTIRFDTSGLSPTDTWSATFPTPGAMSLFQSACKFGNGSGASSSCQVVASPPTGTYSYTVTINGVTLDPHVIIKSSGN